MKSLFSKYIWLQLILAILLLFGGALIVVFTIIDNVNFLESGLNIVSAVILFLFGLFSIVASFAFEQGKVFTNGLFYGSACIALGVFLCTKELILLNYLVYLLAIFFITIGAVELINGIILVVKKGKVFTIVMTFIAATVLIAGGILAIIFREDVKLAFCIVAGVLIFLAGIYQLFFGIKAMIANSKNKESKKEKKATKKEQPNEEVKELDYTNNNEVTKVK